LGGEGGTWGGKGGRNLGTRLSWHGVSYRVRVHPGWDELFVFCNGLLDPLSQFGVLYTL